VTSTSDTRARRLGWAAFGLLALLLVVRVWTMTASGSGLHVDEAQYWVWSRELQWGYYSKPPVIAALIKASTWLLGDSVLGIRLLSMVCWLAASAVLVWLGTQMYSSRAGLWAGALLAATPASNLLGLVATTDAALLLGWTLCMALTWHAVNGAAKAGFAVRPGWRLLCWWAAAGLALGGTLLSKYTALALLPSLAWVLWRAARAARPQIAWHRQWWAVLAGPSLAAMMALLCLLPHLFWNANHHWPTFQHTLDITVRASQAPGSGAAALIKSFSEHLAGQLLLMGPALWLVAVAALASRRGGEGHTAEVVTSEAWLAPAWWALAFALPLQALALVQALKGGTQLNWSAPSLAGLCLAGGLWLAAHPQYGRRALLALLLAFGLTTWVAVSHDLRFWYSGVRDAAYRPLDFWHKTRHWDVVLQKLNVARLAHPGQVVATVERDVLVQAAYAWRLQPPSLQSWRDGGIAKNHFEMMSPLNSAVHAELLFLGTDPPPAKLASAFADVELLARVSSGRVSLGLWLLRRTPPPEVNRP
jgi:4-amino-4-deoxy-L-arabinose transferase-like glycosyltransferase